LFPNHDSDQVASLSLTRALMVDGVAAIVNGTIGYDGFEVAVDALGRKRGKSFFGAYHYEPMLFTQKLAASTNDQLVLGFLGLVLSKIQDRIPEYGTIISGNEHKTRRIRLQKLINCAKKELNVLLSEKVEPQLFLNSHCKQCEHEHSCIQKARESDHLSLIHSLSKKEILKLNAKGIFTVTQLSYTFRPRRKRKGPLILKDNPALRALAIRERKTYIVESPKVSSGQVFVYVDVEGIPSENFVYLVGVLAVDAERRKLYQFWADTQSEQKKIWHQFVNLIKEFESPIIFHHGNYDAVFFKKMQAAHGGFEEAFLKENVVNTVGLLFGRIFFPTFSNGLKDIADFLGFKWASKNVSGLQSIQWRKTWETGADDDLKGCIMQYNYDDCQALEVLVNHIRGFDGTKDTTSAVYCNDLKNKSQFGVRPNIFAFPELTLVNKAAYFDYQQSKIFWRTDKNIQKREKRIEKVCSRKIRKNKIINLAPPKRCPMCQSLKIERREKTSRIIYDLKFTDSGVKRWIVHYTGHRFTCKNCKKYFLSSGHPDSHGKYGHGLLAWSVYQHIGLRQSLENVAKCIRDIFGMRIRGANAILEFKERAANLYRRAYDEILEKIRCGYLIHIDETKVSIQGATGYVWVFTNLEEVAYVYSASREGTILAEVIPRFNGVVISDYYPAYDGLECKQQRCLIHLIRDLNDDLFKNQFDGEFKVFVQKFGGLLKPIIETIDKYGLKKHYLRRHKKAVDRFFKLFVISDGKSELTQKYQKRFSRNRDRLFTFLDYDGVPWNNNNAENAIKGFATLRKVIGGTSTEKGLRDSLALLSICQTLRNKGHNNLNFFRSKEVSLYEYLKKYN
jgi:predicted RecB family nuclease